MAMMIRDDIGTPRERRWSGQRHAPVRGVASALDGLAPGQCLEVVGVETSPGWGYRRACDASTRWSDRQYRASRAGGVWRIWRVR